MSERVPKQVEVTRVASGLVDHVNEDPAHVWEIAFNPGFPLDDSGNLTVPPLGAGS